MEYKNSLKLIETALECYMGDDLKEDNNLSRTVKKSLNNIKEEFSLLEKALLLACEKISFNEDNYYGEPETQEEAQDTYIYKKYTRPKELMERYIKRVQE